MTHELKNNKRVQQLRSKGAAPGERTSQKNIEVSVSGSLERVYEFYPVVLEEIPQAQVYAQIFLVDDTATKITNSTGNMVFTVAATKKFQFVVSA